MSTAMILAIACSLFLVVVGMAVGLAIAEHSSHNREHRQALYQQQLNAQRAWLDTERRRLDERDRRSGSVSSRNS